MQKYSFKETYQDQMIVRFGDEFIREIYNLPKVDKHGRTVFVIKNPIWEYIPSTTMKLYWMNKKMWLYKLADIRWQRYLQGDLIYPESSFANYLLTQDSETKYYHDSVNMEISIWFKIKNKILQ